MTTTEQVRQHLESCDLSEATAANTAEALGMTFREMLSRLYAEDSAYRRLLRAERKRRALELLESSARRPKGLVMAHALGYTTDDNFYRAFQGLFGVGYRDYRGVQ